jgi:hypothetical protein
MSLFRLWNVIQLENLIKILLDLNFDIIKDYFILWNRVFININTYYLFLNVAGSIPDGVIGIFY